MLDTISFEAALKHKYAKQDQKDRSRMVTAQELDELVEMKEMAAKDHGTGKESHKSNKAEYTKKHGKYAKKLRKGVLDKLINKSNKSHKQL